MTIAFWRDDYCTGNEVIDNQHKHLFRLINTLHNAMLEGHGAEVINRTLEELSQYTVEHFQTEESLMVAANYPGYAAHHKKHEELRQDVLLLLEESKSATGFFNIKVSQFLTDWLIYHIQGEDAKMIKFFRNSNFSHDSCAKNAAALAQV